MPKDRLEKFRTKAFFKLLGQVVDLPEKKIADKFKKVGITTYHDYLKAINQLVIRLMQVGFSLEDAKAQASIGLLAMILDWQTGPLARRLLTTDVKGLEDISSYIFEEGLQAYGKKFGEESINDFRPTALTVWEAIVMDLWPASPAAIADFWLTDQQHYEALYYPIRAGEITVEDLDRVLGDPKAITELVNSMPSNPHKGIVFGDAPRLDPLRN